MLKREFGPARVPVIGQGTWRLRGPEAVDALRTGIELGLTHIDTAELYGTEELFAEAVRIAGPGRIACNQVLYNLGERHVEARVLPACREFGAVLVGYSPFDNLPEGGELAAVAAELHATRRQVALAFLVRLPGTFAIPKASSVAHVRENAGAASLKLTEQQIAWLERAYPLHVRNELPTS